MKTTTTKSSKKAEKKVESKKRITTEAVKLSPTAAKVLEAQTPGPFVPSAGGPLERYNSTAECAVADSRLPMQNLEDVDSLLRSLRHEVDHGTGSGIIGDGESSYALAHRLTAHDIITCIEGQLDDVARFVREIVSAAKDEAKTVAS